jgi:hypothetical protein
MAETIVYNPTSDIKRAIAEKWYSLNTHADIQFFYNCLLFHGRVDRLNINGIDYDLSKTPVTPKFKNLEDGHDVSLFIQIGWVAPTIELRIENVRELYFPILQVLSYAVIEMKGDKVSYYDNNNCSVLADRMFWRYHDKPLADGRGGVT